MSELAKMDAPAVSVDVVRVRPGDAFTIPAPAQGDAMLPPTECLLLCVEQVGAYLGGVSVRTVWALVSSGDLPAPFKLGRLSRWRRADLDEWAAGLR